MRSDVGDDFKGLSGEDQKSTKPSVTICEAGSGQKCFVSMSDTDSSNKDCNVTLENRMETNYQARNGSAPPNGNLVRPPTSLPLIVEKDTSSCEMKETKLPPPPPGPTSLRIKPQPPPVPIRQTTLSISSVPVKDEDFGKRADIGYSR